MWAGAVWAMFSFSVGAVYQMLSLAPDSVWILPLRFAAAIFFLLGWIILCWPLHKSEQRTIVLGKLQHPAKWMAELIEPSHVIILGLLIALSGAIWLWRHTTPNPRIAELESQVVSLTSRLAVAIANPPAMPKETVAPVRLVPNLVPLPPGTNEQRLERYVQLKEALTRAEQYKKTVAAMAPQLENYMIAQTRGGYLGPAGGQMAVQTEWEVARDKIKGLNSSLYPNRAMDLNAIPELAIPTAKAPQEDVFGTDFTGAYNYRVLHFSNIHTLRTADALVADIKKELDPLAEEIIKTPAGKAVQ